MIGRREDVRDLSTMIAMILPRALSSLRLITHDPDVEADGDSDAVRRNSSFWC